MASQITEILKTAIIEAQSGIAVRKQLFSDANVSGEHEFLFFIKPEITIKSDSIDLDPILSMIVGKIKEFKLQIKNAVILPAVYLDKYSIIAQHYGVINAIARNAKENLSSGAKERFKEQFSVDINVANVFGGLELIKAYPSFTPETVDYLWQNSPTVKLGGGAYCQQLKFDGQPIYLVNGFHPRQLEHFVAPGRSIIAFTLVGNTSWKEARNNFIGKTNPADALPGSIRRMMLENKEKFGLTAVNSSWNGVHLSAGPIEGLVELIRYNSDLDSGRKLSATDFTLGKKLNEYFKPEVVEKILQNCVIMWEGKETNVFDLTEEKDALEALAVLKKIF
jgi:hypothetical protein